MLIPTPPKKTSELGYTPKCPCCKKDANFDVALDEHTSGSNGNYELVICQDCHCVIGCSLANTKLEN
jgi:hypothetical protein